MLESSGFYRGKTMKSLFDENRLPVPQRRSFAVRLLALGGLALAGSALAQEKKDAACARASLSYKVDYKASPKRVYEALLDPKKFAAFSGLPAEIDAREGGWCSLFGGLIVARNVELVVDQRVVQAWRPAHWKPGVFSIVRFEMTAKGTGSALSIDHAGFPEGTADGLDQGWHAHYIDGLEKYFA
jgi:activator of HSP90 ATPase